ncbi:MAG TPA: OmpA family protein [Terracidiphilus sp.]|jgi:outer membrane protein OmpA-like peptidoglycan-associated protein|nr:OmpA family protein [Terracidiphilus sp.]
MTKYGFGISMAVAAFAVAGVTGCATKNYVRSQTAPIIQHTGQLEDQTAANTRSIQDTDQRAQAGIKQAQSAADAASQNAQSANTAAGNATTAANDAVHRANRLDDVVQGLDKYKQVADVTVTFGFDKSTLTADDKEQLDQFAAQLGTAQHYILQVTGGTDSTGPKQYNYDLSQRRADAVVQYLAAKYNIAPHRFYLIGIGEDQEVADNSTREGRQKNRRVEVQLLTNMAGQEPTAPSATNGAGN